MRKRKQIAYVNGYIWNLECCMFKGEGSEAKEEVLCGLKCKQGADRGS